MIAKHKYDVIIFVMVSILLTSFGIATGENENTLDVVPDQIQIGAFYHGAEITVTANVESCDGAVIILQGNSDKVTLNRKGRVAFIWMNVAKITIDQIPQVYIMATSDTLENICTKIYRDDLKLGVESLRRQMKMESDKELTGEEFDEFLKLKIHDRTYNINNNAELESISPGKNKVTAILPISSKIPPGDYKIRLYCFREGIPIDEKTCDFKIERVGLPGLMTNLATEHPAVYGILAIIIAMAAGIIMGFIFSSLPGKGN
jgi:uncharacterized protein (TIGR02186 family)